MAILLGLDFETTGLNPETDKVIEVGAVFWDTEVNAMISASSILISKYDKKIVITPEIEAITGISKKLLWEHGFPIGTAKVELWKTFFFADYFVAHNAAFEKSFFPQVSDSLYPDRLWIDTKTDLPYPPGKGYGSLTHIAADHGFLNPFPHRALPDAMTMMQVLSKYDFAEVERNALAPVRHLMLKTGKFDETGETQKKARALGYYFDYTSKKYRKPVKDFRVQQELAAAVNAGMEAILLEADPVGGVC